MYEFTVECLDSRVGEWVNAGINDVDELDPIDRLYFMFKFLREGQLVRVTMEKRSAFVR